MISAFFISYSVWDKIINFFTATPLFISLEYSALLCGSYQASSNALIFINSWLIQASNIVYFQNFYE